MKIKKFTIYIKEKDFKDMKQIVENDIVDEQIEDSEIIKEAFYFEDRRLDVLDLRKKIIVKQEY